MLTIFFFFLILLLGFTRMCIAFQGRYIKGGIWSAASTRTHIYIYTHPPLHIQIET